MKSESNKLLIGDGGLTFPELIHMLGEAVKLSHRISESFSLWIYLFYLMDCG